MAEEKKSFIGYCDWLQLVEDLDNEESGKIFQWLLKYVNSTSENNPPYPNEKHLKIICKVLQKQLYEDFLKWKEEKEKRIEAGRKGGLATQSKAKQSQAVLNYTKGIEADNVNVNVNVNDNVNVFKEKNNIKKEEEQIKTLTEFLEELQELLGMLAPKYNDLAVKMYNDLGYEKALSEIKDNMDQPNPINATYLKLYNNKVESSGSEWLDKMKKGL